jgi:magnesium chelatase family protein
MLERWHGVYARVSMSAAFLARFMLAAAMNPCPCGRHGSKRECRRTQATIQRYVSITSEPLMHRIDIHLDVPEVTERELRCPGSRSESSAQMSTRQIRRYCDLGADREHMQQGAIEQQGLSARARDRILGVTRIIDDMGGATQIESKHIADAIQCTTPDRGYWA